ncbi:hypothetical protein ATANTOWER_020988 [Ataeniobius toweri]|uniref:Uncharacterized protein n=1 Tax=Ataeniobius toweri TaxID=208326 RepID=A0ABU7BIS6_9TELE|nr:hypothetical protein [Ataeniobius toweri]
MIKSKVTDSQLDSVLDFDQTIVLLESALIQTISSLAACLGWLSYWKVNLHRGLKFSPASNRFSSCQSSMKVGFVESTTQLSCGQIFPPAAPPELPCSSRLLL